MAILDRNFGNVSAASGTWTITRSTGSYGTGTVIVVVVFANSVFTTPGGWTQRTTSLSNLGLYSYDVAGAGQSSLAITCSPAGTGQWYAWELSAGSTWVGGTAAETASTGASIASPSITPSAGNRHLFASVGGIAGGAAMTVTGVTNSFTLRGQAQSTSQDWVLSAGADRDVTADGTTAYTTTGSFSGSPSVRGAFTLAYINNGGDATAPTVPTGLTTTAIGPTTANLSWTAATDAVGVTGYEVMVVGP